MVASGTVLSPVVGWEIAEADSWAVTVDAGVMGRESLSHG